MSRVVTEEVGDSIVVMPVERISFSIFENARLNLAK